MHASNRLIVGCGYLGGRVARNWVAQGHCVYAVTRSPAKAKELEDRSIIPLLLDIAREGELPIVPSFDTVLFAVGFDRAASQSIHEVYVLGLQRVLNWLSSSPPRRFIYISTTGVYGDAAGEWVDEESLCLGQRDGGKASLEAESLLKASPWRERILVLRLAGLYGPERLPNRADLLAGRPIAASESGYLNLTYVEDAALAVDTALERGTPPRTYNVTDGSPVLRGDYYREVAKQLGAPPPQFDDATNSSRRARSGADKRVSSARIVRELNFLPRYPSYQEGIEAAIREEGLRD